MRVSTSNLVAAFLSAALLAACGEANNGLFSSMPISVAPQMGAPLSPLPARLPAARMHSRPAYSVLHSFEGYPDDGAYPYAGLINVSGTLYGTTSYGGSQCFSSGACGTVFAITTSGTETVLYSFGQSGYSDGSVPTDDLIAVAGTLYGTTSAGGAHDDGMVFAMTPSGEEKVLHGFKGSPDGFDPFLALSTSRARSTARPNTRVQTVPEQFLRSRHPGRRPYSTALQVHQTAQIRMRASSTSTARSTALLTPAAARGATPTSDAERSSRSRPPAGSAYCIASALEPTAKTHLPASSRSTARSTARPNSGAQTATERFS